MPYFPSTFFFQGAFHFPTENKVKASCCGHFPALVSRRPLSFTSQECRAVPLVGPNLGKTSLRNNLEFISWNKKQTNTTRTTFPETEAKPVLVQSNVWPTCQRCCGGRLAFTVITTLCLQESSAWPLIQECWPGVASPIRNTMAKPLILKGAVFWEVAGNNLLSPRDSE